MGEDFRRKELFVAGWHKTKSLEATTYSYVLSMDSVWIKLAISELNDLDKLACGIHNAYLVA